MSSILETVRSVLAGAGSAPVSDSDALALAVHASLEHDGLRCIATDESDVSSGPATAPPRTKPLPASWNKSQDVYSFFYRHESSPALVVVKGVVMDDTMIVHAASDRVDDVHTLELRQDFFFLFHLKTSKLKEKFFCRSQQFAGFRDPDQARSAWSCSVGVPMIHPLMVVFLFLLQDE